MSMKTGLGPGMALLVKLESIHVITGSAAGRDFLPSVADVGPGGDLRMDAASAARLLYVSSTVR